MTPHEVVEPTGLVQRLARYFRALWRGEAPLVSAFWDWGILGGVIVHAASSGLLFWAVSESAPLAVEAVAYLSSIPYSLFAFVAVWRSAAAYRGPPWRATAARWAITAWTVVTCVAP
jgi:hypothetical protein